MQIQMRLGNPVLIFIHSAALLLQGWAIGIRWGNSPAAAVWIALLGVALTNGRTRSVHRDRVYLPGSKVDAKSEHSAKA
jgi:hypothetical protein